MDPVVGSEDVFLRFKGEFGLDGDGDVNAIGLFAFSIVEKERMEWLEHYRAVNNSEPTEHQNIEWYKNKPDAYFTGIGISAYRWFYAFSRALLKDEIEIAKKNAVKEAIADIGKFWPNFWLGNLVGLTSNIVFAVMIVLFGLYTTSDFSFVAWAKKLLIAAPVP